MSIKEIMGNPILSSLPPEELKAYLIFKSSSKKDILENFSIKGTLREWQEKEDLFNMPTSKNKVKAIIRSLENKKIITIKNETLTILI